MPSAPLRPASSHFVCLFALLCGDGCVVRDLCTNRSGEDDGEGERARQEDQQAKMCEWVAARVARREGLLRMGTDDAVEELPLSAAQLADEYSLPEWLTPRSTICRPD